MSEVVPNGQNKKNPAKEDVSFAGFFNFPETDTLPPPDGLDVNRMCGVGLDAAADAVDVNHDGRRVADGVEAPDVLEELFFREDDAGMLGEECQEFVLFVREGELFFAEEDAVREALDAQLAAHELLRWRGSRLGRARFRPLPQDALVARDMRFHAGDELAGRKRLRDVVVGAEAEAADLVDVLAARRDDEDGHFALRADVTADGEAVAPRQHDVEQHEGVAALRELCEAGLAVCLDGDGEIRRFEEVALHLGNLDVVFDDQNLVH